MKFRFYLTKGALALTSGSKTEIWMSLKMIFGAINQRRQNEQTA